MAAALSILLQPVSARAVGLYDFRSLTAGQDHTCALDEDGHAYCWGSNSHGQLGIGKKDSESHTIPVAVSGGHIFREISAGFLHTCGIERNGAAFCWGSNENGQLGTGTREAILAPNVVKTELRFQTISAGATHTCGLDAAGGAYCWGGNWHGQIGAGSFEGDSDTSCCVKEPAAVKTSARFSAITAGGISTCAITVGQRAYCWGNGNDGRLGIHSGDLKDRPQPVEVASTTAVRAIAVRGHHSCGLTADGGALCWGQATEGQLGAGSSAKLSDAPLVAVAGRRFKSVTVGMDNTCAIDNANHLFCWGESRFGAVTGAEDSHPVAPRQLFGSLEFLLVSAGGNDFSGHTCALTKQHAVLCWGDNRKGQLGPFAANPLR